MTHPDQKNSAQGVLARELSSMDALFKLFATFAAEASLPPELESELSVVAEELFVNAVRHNPDQESGVDVALSLEDGWVELRLVDRQAAPFDITKEETGEVDRPILERREGGMGLHLVRELADELSYSYENGFSTIIFRKRVPA